MIARTLSDKLRDARAEQQLASSLQGDDSGEIAASIEAIADARTALLRDELEAQSRMVGQLQAKVAAQEKQYTELA